MDQVELAAVRKQGADARRAGASFHSNPHYFAAVPTDKPGQLESWVELCSAWGGGWLEEDAGRTEWLARMMLMRAW
jgi:hypothetical protein